MTDAFNLQSLLQDIVVLLVFSAFAWLLRKLGINLRHVRSEIQSSHESVKYLSKQVQSATITASAPSPALSESPRLDVAQENRV